MDSNSTNSCTQVAAGNGQSGPDTISGVTPEPGDFPDPSEGPQSTEKALAEDLALVAKAKGWTIEEATADRQAADAVGEIAVRVAVERPDIFVGSVVAPEPGEPPSLYIKGPSDEFVRGLVGDAEIEIKIIDNQPYSFDELEQRKLEVHRALEAQGFRYVSTGFSVTGAGQIRAGVTRQAGLPADSTEILANLPAALRDSVDLTISEAPVIVDHDAFGGMRVTGQQGDCTSGWSVSNSSGTTGVTTAGHCEAIDEIVRPGAGSLPLSFHTSHRGQWGDVEWHTSTDREPPKFYSDSTTVRNVGAVEARFSISQGESVCLYGRSSDTRDCSLDVEDVSQACTNDNVFNDRLVLMDGDVAIGGDSGGGWSFGVTAYGSHKGNCNPDFPNQNAFSVADLFDEAIGVKVRLYVGSETAGIFRQSSAEWRLNDQHNDPNTDYLFYYGQSGDKAVYGDWNADGKGNIGTFRKVNANDGKWYLNNQLDGSVSEYTFTYGLFSDKPVAGEWLGSGSRPGVYRAQGNDGKWYINYGFDGSSELSFTYGLASDLPIAGDWDCDGDQTVGVFRNGTWYLNNEFDGTSSYSPISYGQAGDIPVAGDWDGDGCDTIGVYRSGTWYLNDDLDGASEYIYSYGISTDQPVVGDWDGN